MTYFLDFHFFEGLAMIFGFHIELSNFESVYLFWPSKRGHSVVKLGDNSRISYKCIKIVDLFIQVHTGCPKCQISFFFLHVWPFGYSIWPWRNKPMYFNHIWKVAQLSTVLITIWISTFHKFSEGIICGKKGQLAESCLWCQILCVSCKSWF